METINRREVAEHLFMLARLLSAESMRLDVLREIAGDSDELQRQWSAAVQRCKEVAELARRLHELKGPIQLD